MVVDGRKEAGLKGVFHWSGPPCLRDKGVGRVEGGDLARSWRQRTERLSATGRISVSQCECDTEAILCEPGAIRRAEFWIDWTLPIEVWEEFGNQIGAA